MNRERLAWLMSFLLLTVAALRNPLAAQRDSDYRFVRTLVDIHRQVVTNYVEGVDGQKLEQAAIDGMLSQLDPFTNYVPPTLREEFDRALEGTRIGVGIELNQRPDGQWEVIAPMVGGPAIKAGVMAGDIILKVNGESIDGMRLQEVVGRITGPLGTEVRLTVRHTTGEEVELTMKRDSISVPTIRGYRRGADNNWEYFVSESPKIAYLRLTQFTPTTYDSLSEILQGLMQQGMRGLILDLRWNPGGQLEQAVQVVDLFINEGTIVKVKGRNRPEDARQAVAPGTLPYFPMLVLVNEHSASAAEIVAGSLMDNKRAAVLGERSYGKGSVQELIPLEGNSGELKLTVAYYYLPSGRLVHRKKDATDWGVEPQIRVPMDETMQRAVLEERADLDRNRRPRTQPATAPTTQPVDVQLQRAVETMILMTLMQNNAAAATAPATQPAR